MDSLPIVAERMKAPDGLVVTGAVDYLSVWYYTPTEFQPRVMYLADPVAELEATGGDTVDRGYLALARWTLVPIVPLDSFIQSHRRFWLFALGNDDRWIEPRLRSWRASFTPGGSDPSGRLFDVQLPER